MCQCLHVEAKCSKDMKDCRRTVRCLLMTAELLLRFIVPCPFTGSPTFKAGLQRQQDALLLNFILVKNSTCCGQTYCPSSGVLILYSQQLL